jgi:NADH-quinone oxidoreductase subunit D
MTFEMQSDNVLIERLAESGDMLVNFGPQHPSTHGVINFLVQTDGEVMRRAVPQVGYLHRSIEKIAEGLQYPQFMPYTDRVDYLAAMMANEGWALATEKLLGKVEVPPRAQYLRCIASEFCRIASHLIAVGTNASDLGAFTPFLHGIREREYINDLLEALCGARLTYNYFRVGGVAFDLPEGWADRARRFLDRFEPFLDEFDRLISFNQIFIKRLANVGVVTREEAVTWGLAGPSLRASGVDFDTRRDMPYGVYPQLSWNVVVGKGWQGTVGDCFDRYYCRVLEMRESAKIIRQCLDKMPEGEIAAKLPRRLKPEAGEAMAAVESARGQMVYYVVSDGTEKPWRVRIRTASFMAMGIMEPKSVGLMIADLIALIASFDVVAPEIDR